MVKNKAYAIKTIEIVKNFPHKLRKLTFRQAGSGGFLRLHWNWANELDSWLWFYIKNLGLIFILLLPAFICARRESRLFYGGALLLWAISEFVVFQPNT